MAVLPAEIPTGLVTGQFYFVNEDNVDADTDPTLQVVTGRVTFTCEAESPLRMPNKDAVIIPLVFEAEFDAQGRLVPKGQTNLGIELPASDSPEFNPTGFTWRVSFDLSDATTGYTIRMESFSIFVPGGVTSDLVDLMPVSTEPGTLVVQGPRGEQGIQGPKGDNGTGVPTGGTALQLVRKNAANTGTEWATPTKSLVGLGNVDNTSDAAKPLSSPQQNWILSRGTDLISNGTGLLGNNTNFSSFTLNPDAPMGAAGAFDVVGTQTLFNDEDIPVDTARRYLIRLMVKQRNASITGSRFYAGLAPRDKQGLAIMPQHYAYTTGTTTTLTAALNPGDTTVNVSSTANWFADTAAETYRYIGFWNWVDPAGRLWPQHTYTRNTAIYTAFTATTVTLKTAYAGPALPAGTPLSNTRLGSNYMYIPASNQIAPLQWTEFSGTVGGLHDGNGGSSATTKFPPGTAYIRLLFLASYANTGVPAGETSTQSFGAISFSDATQALKELDSKAPLNSPAFTGTPTGITKAHVGLPNVDNTSDANKPVSAPQQAELNKKIGLVTTFAELQTAVAAGGTVRVGDTPITITAKLSVTSPTKIIGGKFTLPTSAGYPAFEVTSNDVTFDGCAFTGAGTSAAYDINSRFIYAIGASTNYLTNINVLNCKMVGSQTENIRFHFVRGFKVTGNKMDDFLYAGFLGLSVENGSISENEVTNAVMKSPVVNVYGIGVTDSANTVALRSRNVRIIGNHIFNIPWEGIDTHGGEAIVIQGNELFKCVRGIALVVGNATRLTVPIDCVVSGNIIDRQGALDGATEREGISLFGLSGNLASATITGNIIKGYSATKAMFFSTYIDPLKTLVEGNSHPHVPWTNITMDNPTVWEANATYTPQYMVDGRTVYLRGLATSKTSATANAKMGTLPTLCATDRLEFAGTSKGSNTAAGTGTIAVYPSAEVWMLYKSTGDLYSYTMGCSYQRNYTG